MAEGEFHPGDAALAARLVNTACIRFRHPRLMAEYEQEPEPVLDQMVDFCIAALVPHPHSPSDRVVSERRGRPVGAGRNSPKSKTGLDLRPGPAAPPHALTPATAAAKIGLNIAYSYWLGFLPGL
jgi:hypothetical protein